MGASLSGVGLSQSSAVLLGVAVPGLVAILVVVLQQGFVRRDRRREAQAQRLSQFATSAWTAALTVGVIARQPADQKDAPRQAMERDRTQAFDDYTNALNLIYLLEPVPVAQAARRFDEGIRDLGRTARERQFTREEWREIRKPLRRCYDQYLRVARTGLRMPELPWKSTSTVTGPRTKAPSRAREASTEG